MLDDEKETVTAFDAVIERIEKLEAVLSILRDHARIADLTYAINEWSRVCGYPPEVIGKVKQWFREALLN